MAFQPDFRIVRNTFAEILEAKRGHINARFAEVHADIKLGSVLPYFSENIEHKDYQLLMLEQAGENGAWEALDTGSGPIADRKYDMILWGCVHGFDERFLDDAVGVMAAAVCESLNRNHFTFNIGTWQFYYDETLPAPNVTYGIKQFGRTVVRAFNVGITVSCIYSIPQEHGSPRATKATL